MNPFVHGDQFERDMALVMIHRHHQVEFSPAHPVEHRVGRKGADAVDALFPGEERRRRNLLDFFPAECAVLARVGI